MKKTAIITHYYNSKNYGGMLQAYALIKAISAFGYEAEQLCFFQKEFKKKELKKKKFRMRKFLKLPLRWCKKFVYWIIWKSIAAKINLREEDFERFSSEIPHSENIYTTDNMCECINYYNTFITGSDQVWNMDWYHKEYFLEFVPDDMKKISYAASMPNTNISKEQEEIVLNHLKSFDAISVREKETVPFLEKLTGQKVEWVLDPTLLLSREEWDEICSERVVKEKYIFCYFLGMDKLYRKNAKKFAKKMGYKIVTLPHLHRVNINDVAFGDWKLYDISPNQFISLIKHAEYVITDSFHAVVFSNIYGTKYFVFNRSNIGKMSSRIESILSLTGEKFRFCTGENQSAAYMLSKKDIEVPLFSEDLRKMKEKSIEFLKQNLND